MKKISNKPNEETITHLNPVEKLNHSTFLINDLEEE